MVAILFFFLNARVAWWVTMGIPVSFMAALALMWLAGGSINMISLFALIMTLGINVDDAIVVGEDALTHYQRGERSLQAAEGGARRMLAPVLSSSLTTVAAFVPLMAVSGIIGSILFDIPFVVICVILASLVESFLVLPGHLTHSFRRAHHKEPSPLRARLDAAFDRFRDNRFRPLVEAAVRRPSVTLAFALASLILTVGLIAGGRLGFTFFPTVEGNVIYAQCQLRLGHAARAGGELHPGRGAGALRDGRGPRWRSHSRGAGEPRHGHLLQYHLGPRRRPVRLHYRGTGAFRRAHGAQRAVSPGVAQAFRGGAGPGAHDAQLTTGWRSSRQGPGDQAHGDGHPESEGSRA